MAELNEIKGFWEPCKEALVIALEMVGGKERWHLGPCSSSLRVAPLVSVLYTEPPSQMLSYPRFPKKQILRQECMC